jgi:hypothetical protein
MRSGRKVLCGVCLLLATCVVWNSRFEYADFPSVWETCTLAVGVRKIEGLSFSQNGASPSVRVARSPAGKPFAALLPLPGAGVVPGLMVSAVLRGEGLQPGKHPWEDGRLIIEWRSAVDGATILREPVASVRDDLSARIRGSVFLPRGEGWVPWLRVENLGASGAFRISDLRIAAVRERSIWRTGKFFLIAAWGLWIGWLVKRPPPCSKRVPVVCAVLWVFLAINMVLPGPWTELRSLILPFRLGDMPEGSSGVAESGSLRRGLSVEEGRTVAPASRLIEHRGWLLNVKALLERLRPLFHAAALAVPAFLFAIMAGWRVALLLAGMLALGSEAAQTAFGYGFNLTDVADLLCDAAGIGMALWIASLMKPVLERFFRRHEVTTGGLVAR